MNLPMTDKKFLVACIPVNLLLVPPTYSLYEQVPCPRCTRAMWLGERGKKMVEAGASMLCMPCIAYLGNDGSKIIKLTDMDHPH